MHKKYYINEEELTELELQAVRAIYARLDAMYNKLAKSGKADIVLALEESDVIQEQKSGVTLTININLGIWCLVIAIILYLLTLI